MAADFSGPIPKEPPLLAPKSCCGGGKLQVVLGFGEDYKVVCAELTRESKSERGKSRTPGEARRMAAARLLTKRLNRSGESTPAQCRYQPKEMRPPRVLGLARVCRRGNWQSFATYPLSRPAWCNRTSVASTHEVSNAFLMSTKAQKVCWSCRSRNTPHSKPP